MEVEHALLTGSKRITLHSLGLAVHAVRRADLFTQHALWKRHEIAELRNCGLEDRAVELEGKGTRLETPEFQ
jgi:hypothetical protein